jgi:hypothetical protein
MVPEGPLQSAVPNWLMAAFPSYSETLRLAEAMGTHSSAVGKVGVESVVQRLSYPEGQVSSVTTPLCLSPPAVPSFSAVPQEVSE